VAAVVALAMMVPGAAGFEQEPEEESCFNTVWGRHFLADDKVRARRPAPPPYPLPLESDCCCCCCFSSRQREVPTVPASITHLSTSTFPHLTRSLSPPPPY
jgi:hypothetical protein